MYFLMKEDMNCCISFWRCKFKPENLIMLEQAVKQLTTCSIPETYLHISCLHNRIQYFKLKNKLIN